MEESLSLTGELSNISIPSNIEISMDTQNFSMKNIVTYATPKVLEEDIDWSKLDKLFIQANELQTASNKLEDGTNKLKKGISELNNGASELADGASRLADGTDELYKTISAKISELKELEKKYMDKEEINTKITEIVNDNMDLVIEVAMKNTENEINAKLKDIENSGEILSQEQRKALIDAVKKDIQEVLAEVKSKTEELRNVLIDAVIEEIKSSEVVAKKTITDQIEDIKTLTDEEKTKLKTVATPIITELVKGGMSEEDATKMVMGFADTISENTIDKVEKEITDITTIAIDSAISKIESKSEIDTALENYKNAIISNISNSLTNGDEEALKQVINGVEKAINDKVEERLANNHVLNEVKKQIRAELNATVKDVVTDTTNDIVDIIFDREFEKNEPVINEKIKELETVADALQDALYQVNDGAKQLKNGSRKLANGTKQLLDGSNTLSYGMHEFNSKGINKINKLVNGDLYNLKERGQKLNELSKEYKLFESENETDKIKFISIIDSVKKSEKDEGKEKAILTEEDKKVKTDEK